MKCSSVITYVVTAIGITIIVLVVYAAVQQTHRSSANDTQLKITGNLSAVWKGKATDHLKMMYGWQWCLKR